MAIQWISADGAWQWRSTWIGSPPFSISLRRLCSKTEDQTVEIWSAHIFGLPVAILAADADDAKAQAIGMARDKLQAILTAIGPSNPDLTGS